VSPVILRPSRLVILAAVVVLTGLAAVAAEPHRWGSRTCPPYCSSDFGYRPTTWRPWPAVSETPSETSSKPAPKEESELAPPPKEEAPKPKPPAPKAKPDVSPPAPQPPKKPSEPMEPEDPKPEARRDFPPSQSPYNSWNPSLDAASNPRRP
jgi:hypothetical protein